MKKLQIAALAGFGLLALSATPALAAMISGYTTANVNQRSGPSTAYPPITVIPANSAITIYGCLQDDSWCDISWGANRGWMSSAYLQAKYQSHRIPVRGYSAIPFITFNFNSYWNSYYQTRPFFGQRSKWSSFNWQGQGSKNPPTPPKYTGNPPNFGSNDKTYTSGKGSGGGSGQGYGSGNGQGGNGQGYGSGGGNGGNDKNKGKNCKMINGKWVCT